MGPNQCPCDTTNCFVDACLGGMAFWYPKHKLDFQCHIPADYQAPIFYWEDIAVTFPILCSYSNVLPCLIIFTDNQNTVDIWHSMKTSALYNTTLTLAIDSLISEKTDAWVLHIPGVKNVVTDSLSCFNNALTLHLVHSIKLGLFETPHALLGVLKK
jgi:hypothetical protein